MIISTHKEIALRGMNNDDNDDDEVMLSKWNRSLFLETIDTLACCNQFGNLNRVCTACSPQI